MGRLPEYLAHLYNALSIAAYFYLLSAKEAQRQAPLLAWLGLALSALGLALVVASISLLARNRDQKLVDWGVYGLVRHPMYLGALLLFLSMSFLLPTWLTALLSLTNAAICYGFMILGDRLGAERFGPEYGRYRPRVPRANLLAGWLRTLRRA